MIFEKKYDRFGLTAATFFLLFCLSLTTIAQQPTLPRKTISLPNGAKPILKGKYEPTWDSIKKNDALGTLFRSRSSERMVSDAYV